ncbi:MAG: hypothetical protein H6819_12490 [Phycisphaerales bacterium]|nr:hypothetical protein [Phycisphaerales bacterium]MCB9855185.1 hypothetical protein [Phycisphaerales bacterium]MCB9862778.1 hypothetical protein [Phycisphaerales bacterium]
MAEKLQQYGDIVAGLAGPNLAGLTAYGDGLDGATSTIASVLVVHKVDLAQLRLLAERGPALGNLGMMAPVVMTPGYVDKSLDTFPMELMEIHQKHVTLAGRDYFASLSIEDEHLRLQCERELKRILIRMRQGVLAAGGREDVLSELGADVGLHLVRTIRGLIWLRGERGFLPMDQAIGAASTLVGGELPGPRRAVRRDGANGWADFLALYADVERLATYVDGMNE